MQKEYNAHKCLELLDKAFSRDVEKTSNEKAFAKETKLLNGNDFFKLWAIVKSKNEFILRRFLKENNINIDKLNEDYNNSSAVR